MKKTFWCLILILGFLSACGPGLKPIEESPNANVLSCLALDSNIEFEVVQIAGGPKAAVWYPAAIKNNSSTCQALPLVVYSHGLHGCGTKSRYITEGLARQGFVVIAPDHRDAHCASDGGVVPTPVEGPSVFNPELWDNSSYFTRREDLVRVLDWALSEDRFSRFIDPSKIGGVGHSLGGYSVAGLGGAWSNWRDSRVKAVLALSPYLLPYQMNSRIPNIQVPIMYQGATGDIGVTPFLLGSTGVYQLTITQKYLVVLNGGDHNMWTNNLCSGQTTLECLNNNSQAQVINAYGIGFLRRHLKGENVSTLNETNAALNTYLHNP